jgi:hypothetical protein
MSHPANFIGSDHPSFGARQQWFLFATKVKGATQRLLLVDAKNPWAIQCMERMLGNDQRVSPTCECVLVFRDCNIGLRGDMAEEISFEEFVTVMVDPNRWLNDTCTVEAFEQAMRAEQMPVRAAPKALPPARRATPALAPTPVSRPRTTAKTPRVTPPSIPAQAPMENEPNPNHAKLVGVLAGMGFKQAQIEPALKKLKNAPTENFDEMVRLALVNLAA